MSININRLPKGLPIELSIRLWAYENLAERIKGQDGNCTVKTVCGIRRGGVDVGLDASLFRFQNSNQKSQVDTHGLTPMALE